MDILTIACLFDNYAYLVIDTSTKKAAVVDPSEAWPIIREVDTRGLTLTTVLCTHHHNDHIGGLQDLRDEYRELEVIGHHEDSSRIPGLSVALQDGDGFAVGGCQGVMFHTPGHTRTHVAFRLADNLFVGDTLFGAGCGRLFEGTPEQMVHSLELIVGCGGQCRIYFGHEYTEENLRFAALIEPDNRMIEERASRVASLRRQRRPSTPSTVAQELQTNPFLRLTETAVRNHLKSRRKLPDDREITVFAALRELRDHFG